MLSWNHFFWVFLCLLCFYPKTGMSYGIPSFRLCLDFKHKNKLKLHIEDVTSLVSLSMDITLFALAGMVMVMGSGQMKTVLLLTSFLLFPWGNWPC